jgi:hypothetical protein
MEMTNRELQPSPRRACLWMRAFAIDGGLDCGLRHILLRWHQKNETQLGFVGWKQNALKCLVWKGQELRGESRESMLKFNRSKMEVIHRQIRAGFLSEKAPFWSQ